MELLRQDVSDLPTRPTSRPNRQTARGDGCRARGCACRKMVRPTITCVATPPIASLEESHARQVEAWKSKLHVKEKDGKQVTDIERIDSRLGQLSKKLGPWAKQAKNEKTLKQTQQRLEEALEFKKALAEQRKALEAVTTEEAAAL